MNISIKFPAKVLKAMSLFVSAGKEELTNSISRVLLEVKDGRPLWVATNGRILAVCNYSEGFEIHSQERSFEITLPVPNMAKLGWSGERIIQMDNDVPFESYAYSSGDFVQLMQFGSCAYPKWRKVIPGDVQSRETKTGIALNPSYLAAFGRAITLLYPKLSPAVTCMSDDPLGPISVYPVGCKELYGVIMPVRATMDLCAVPDFAK